jgi:hypothetical protein
VSTGIRTTVEEFLKSFDLLPEIESMKQPPRFFQSLEMKSAPMADEELALNAEELFLELDRRESQESEAESN